jgi:hypothetical protein
MKPRKLTKLRISRETYKNIGGGAAQKQKDNVNIPGSAAVVRTGCVQPEGQKGSIPHSAAFVRSGCV